MVLKHGVGFIARHPFGLAVSGKGIVPQADQTVVAADPQVPLSILEEGPHHVALRAGGGRRKAVAFQARDPSVGAGPDVAVAVFQHGAHKVRGQPGVRVEPAQLAVGGPLDQSQRPADPQVVVTVGEQGGDHVSGKPVVVHQGGSRVSRQPDHAKRRTRRRLRKVETGHQQVVPRVLAHYPDRGQREIGAGREDGELASLHAAQIDAGHDPQSPPVVRKEAGDVVVRKSVLDGVGAKALAEVLNEAIGGADPERTIRRGR